MYNTREEWLREAVKLLNDEVFGGELDLIEYQISCALLGGKKLGEVVFPYEGEDIAGLDDFFPPTIHIDEKIKESAQMVIVLAHECIHAFMNIKDHKKRFKYEAKKIGFESPFTQCNPNEELTSKCHDIAKKLGPFPGKPVIPHKKEKKKKTFSGKLFCPNCGFEVRISEKMFKDHGGQMPICPCGTHLALDCTEDPIEDDEN